MMKNYIKYETPEVEVIEVQIEKGFATSSETEDDPFGIGEDFPWGC